MDNLFEITDKTGRRIRLTKERWKHIKKEHPEIVDYEDIKRTLFRPDKILESDRDEKVKWFFRYNKNKKRYMKVSVKYLNNEGFVITSHYTAKIH